MIHLTFFIKKRKAVTVRAIPYIVGYDLLSPDAVAEELACKVSTPLLQKTVAFRIVENRRLKVLPKEWDHVVAQFEALKARLKREQKSDSEGFAKWLKKATPLLPAGVFVWLKDLSRDLKHMREKITIVHQYDSPRRTVNDVENEVQAQFSQFDKRDGDFKLNLSPMLSTGQLEMIMEGVPIEPDTKHRPNEIFATNSAIRRRPLTSGESQGGDVFPRNDDPNDNRWKAKARKIAEGLLPKYEKLSLDQIAEKVRSEMVDRNKLGETGLTGRGGRIPGASSIKRHALTGLKS